MWEIDRYTSINNRVNIFIQLMYNKNYHLAKWSILSDV